MKHYPLVFLLALLAFSCEPPDLERNRPDYPFTLRLHHFESSPPEYYVLGELELQEVTPSAPFVAHVNSWLEFLATSENLDQALLRALHVRGEMAIEAVWLAHPIPDTNVVAGTFFDHGDFLTLFIDNEEIELARNNDFTEVRWCEHMTMRTQWVASMNEFVYGGPSARPCHQISNFDLLSFAHTRAIIGDTIVYIPYDLVYRLEE